ncbi:MAG: phosphoglycerate kinase [Desulfurococcaceae archaeon]
MRSSFSSIPTLRHLDVRGKRIFLRIDVNVPVDPETMNIVDDRRIRIHSSTVKQLIDADAALAIASHQGRPGEAGFTTMEKHAELLSKYAGVEVKFIDDVCGPTARKAIESLKPGEALMLNNLRLASEEVIEATPEKQASTYLVQRLAPLFEAYVNDAFATAHRSQPSIVGFPLVLPSAAGPVMEKELLQLDDLMSEGRTPRVFVFGGARVYDLVKVIENLVAKGMADRILTTGLLANLVLLAKGVNIGLENLKYLEERGVLTLIPRIRHLLMKGAPIETPIDFKVLSNGEVREEVLGRISGKIMDVGPSTIDMYREFMKEAKAIVMKGPAGVIEDSRFRDGTVKLINEALLTRACITIAGGHLSQFVNEEEAAAGKVHVTTGANAFLLALSGEALPGVEILKLSARMFLGWCWRWPLDTFASQAMR